MRSCSTGADRDTRPLVSVVVIFLDEERFLGEAIASVVGQSYPAWELLLVDDGSTDRSTAIARAHAARDPERVRYLEHPDHANRGMSAARNLGVSAARGRYVAFLDADDTWLPNTLADQVDILEAWPEAAIVYGPLSWWYSWSGRPGDRSRDYVEELGVRANALVPPPQLVALILRDRAAVPSGLLVRRDVIDRVGGFEEPFRGEYEDQVFCAKVCLSAPVFASGRTWYRYRQHPESSVAIGHLTGQTHLARWRFLEWLETYLLKQTIDDAEVWSALRHELWRARHPTVSRLLTTGQHLVRQSATRWLRARTWRTRGRGEYADRTC